MKKLSLFSLLIVTLVFAGAGCVKKSQPGVNIANANRINSMQEAMANVETLSFEIKIHAENVSGLNIVNDQSVTGDQTFDIDVAGKTALSDIEHDNGEYSFSFTNVDTGEVFAMEARRKDNIMYSRLTEIQTMEEDAQPFIDALVGRWNKNVQFSDDEETLTEAEKKDIKKEFKARPLFMQSRSEGTETIRGTKTDHLVVRILPDNIVAFAKISGEISGDPATQEELDKLRKDLAAFENVDIHLYIGSRDNRLYRFSFEDAEIEEKDGSTMLLDVTFDAIEFNVELDVEVPEISDEPLFTIPEIDLSAIQDSSANAEINLDELEKALEELQMQFQQ